ncbi:hypothetical protein J2S40_000263 [Nocardioides luteus]|uniref:DUF2000 domain-containing protein n=1 Tax=Nocardioides luteus TaxID=1844 RepID=A0ABQ5SUA6_9ACTN|nr:DUF2000 domain-containing protein [Nocardioides luteus]MDR7309205.1 hypothetical protein [Nocardioides luteus]GGR49103.1 hypothetical protein GCM10010197_13670 [Nocardioides luteus]GLJ67610.1 hypothetical protein GCM10017579_16460 [Nocardioides luteus]
MSTGVETARVGFAPEEIDQSASTREVPLKWVVVVDRDLPAGRAVNAAVCVAGATTQRTTGILGEDAVDADESTHPGLPWIGCTVLGAPTERLTELRRKAVAQPGVAVIDMPTQAQHTRVYDDYLFAVGSSRGADLTYYAISLLGPRRTIDKLVKGLKLLP